MKKKSIKKMRKMSTTQLLAFGGKTSVLEGRPFCLGAYRDETKEEPLHNKRQTGRTTRMLEEALMTARAGRRVCIVMASETEVDRAKQWLRVPSRYNNAHERIEVITPSARSFSWENLQPIGWRAEVFLDHLVIERRIGQALLEMWEKFDA